MKTRELLTTSQREGFYGIPEYMEEREILRYNTIADEELQLINKQRGATNRLGFACKRSGHSRRIFTTYISTWLGTYYIDR
ncbi:DUF4158 domain-containing protein [Bacillus pseudomycoides]|nr:hypothetical protein BLX05_19940 [Bacillus pseudomycoides]PDY09500.1 DUF4158 domain-containing protein [Bacillus pseudomycoides]PEU49415.1 DUF4158 domain-containing protein [Bacillus pseudomycoides]PFY12162.1 DUF4158 domain-containing protein [Bacillus pseudomycoides]PGA65384.1 DUF4158 domain-containing protein [Bacillus pseudomycoides]